MGWHCLPCTIVTVASLRKQNVNDRIGQKEPTIVGTEKRKKLVVAGVAGLRAEDREAR